MPVRVNIAVWDFIIAVSVAWMAISAVAGAVWLVWRIKRKVG